MNEDLKPNGRNFSLWSPEGAFMMAKLAVLRMRDEIANEGTPTADAVGALSAAADAIAEIENSWTLGGHRPTR